MEMSVKLYRADGILASEADSEILMLDIENGLYYGLADVAADIWELLEDPKTGQELIDALCKIYDVDEDTCKAQTTEFLVSLKEHSIITDQDPEA